MTLTAAVVAFTNAVLQVVTNFGFNLSDTQQASISGLVNAGLVLGAIVLSYRQKAQRAGQP